MPDGYSPSKYEKYIRENYKQLHKFHYNNETSKKVIESLRQIIKSK